MKKGIFLLLCSSVLFLLPRTVKAQAASSLSVSPVIFDVTLSPGNIQNYELKVKNMLDVPVPIQLSVEDLDISQKDETVAAPLRSIASWVTFPETDMILPAKSERTIPFTVTIPGYLPLGGYYGIIYLHPFSRESSPQDISSKIGVFILGSIGVQEIPLNKVYLLHPRFSSPIYGGRNAEIQFAVKNTALNHFSAKPFVRITSFFGATQDVPLEEKIIFPGRSRQWAVPITLSSYPAFVYRADLTVSVGNGVQQKTRLYFIAFPFAEALIVIIVSVISGIIIKRRKRIRAVVRILVRG